MKIDIKRHVDNPLITPKDIKPTRKEFKVDGVFNAGATKYKGETILLLRIAESVISTNEDQIAVPVLEKKDHGYEITIKHYDKVKDNEEFGFSDTRKVYLKKKERVANLTSLSHFRIARSSDGVNFIVEDNPSIFPEGKYETWGIEDPRITLIDDEYYINYSAVSELGVAISLIKTKDFKTFERMGIIFPPENKDAAIFPEKINGQYYVYHRPVPKDIGDLNIWVSSSKDLINWGDHEHLMSVSSKDSWENGRIGGGAPSFKTDKGWIHIYHAADKHSQYCLGAFITKLDNPTDIIGKTDEPILIPSEDYEKEGFFGNVVFTCGTVLEDGIVKIYYGASDEVMALAEISVEELYRVLGV